MPRLPSWPKRRLHAHQCLYLGAELRREDTRGLRQSILEKRMIRSYSRQKSAASERNSVKVLQCTRQNRFGVATLRATLGIKFVFCNTIVRNPHFSTGLKPACTNDCAIHDFWQLADS
jgi:hypothetical protein